MGSDFIPTDHSSVDFSFVYELDENSLDIFFSITDMAIEAVKEALREDALKDNVFLKGLSASQLEEMITYYTKLLDLYTDYELYEECEPLAEVLNTLEDFYGKEQVLVANMQEKP